ncbi:MAG: nucleoside triphosphate pyrophosphohydrolase [Candidatus Shapirobacteria bacterium]|nr:nucleoside triphosphate pyrophosphohydrolase [Candidatus Shapirobacteria bacterium]
MDKTKRIYKKLVRDKIPEIIKNNRESFETRILDDEEFEVELKKKLVEEAKEVGLAINEELLEELADVLELVKSIADFKNITFLQIEERRKEKLEKRGGFKKKLFLEWTN